MNIGVEIRASGVSAHGLEKAAKVDILNSVKTTDNLSQEKAANLLEIEELAS